MVKKRIRLGTLLLALVLTAALVPLPRARAADADLTAIVEKQIRAYADSIDQRNADDDAAWALANHGINGGGRKLTAGASHPLTATLMNSELLQEVLTVSCTAAIEFMQSTSMVPLPYIGGGCNWYGANSGYGLYAFSAPGRDYAQVINLLADPSSYTGSLNSYDDSLDWMAGSTNLDFGIERIKTTETEMVFEINMVVSDRFDFNTASNSGFKNLISAIGALLFREFDWEAKASFTLTVPYSCSHTSANYHWSYDSENHILTSDNSNGFTNNGTTTYPYTASGVTSYYHQTDNPVRLLHNRPWVLQYELKSTFSFALAPTLTEKTSLPLIWHNAKTHLLVHRYTDVHLTDEEREEYGPGWDTDVRTVRHDYGVGFKGKFDFSAARTYTIRLENRIAPDGSNMLYMTVYDQDLEQTVLPDTPMTEHYITESGGDYYVLQEEPSVWAAGKDFFINYIGSQYKRLNADHFDLKIWENGESGERFSYFEPKTVAPTCTAAGYTTHTCAACGYSYKTDIVPAAGHSYTTKVTPPTCTEEGYTTYTCTVCKSSHVGDAVAALKHSYGAGFCSRCGDDTVTAVIAGGVLDLRATRGIKVGTWVLLCGYTADGRMEGMTARLWDGTPQTIDLPEGENFEVFFVKEGTWAPLRLPVIPE